MRVNARDSCRWTGTGFMGANFSLRARLSTTNFPALLTVVTTNRMRAKKPTEPVVARSRLRLASLSVVLLVLAGCGGSSEFKTLQAKAKKGDAQAQFELAKMFMYGKGAKQDEVEARKWIEKAASQGVPAAQRIFGTMLRDAYGADHRDIPKAREWLKKAVDQGDAEAKAELAATPELPPASPAKR